MAPSFIWVDKNGKRFADEFSPDGHTRCYVVNRFDPISHSYPSIPCWLIFDDKALQRVLSSADLPDTLLIEKVTSGPETILRN